MTTTYEITAVAPSVVAVLGLPSLAGLTDEQARGAACLWCSGPLTTAAAVDLGEQLAAVGRGRRRWFPRACHPCIAGRAHAALFAHAPSCAPCVRSAGNCETGRTLNRLIREGHR